MIRKEKKRGNEKMHIEGQAMHWPKDKMYQKTNTDLCVVYYYTENQRTSQKQEVNSCFTRGTLHVTLVNKSSCKS